ncbi:MAG TPA: L-serine ammonia-lyase, iron-sulfur-dependent, subunit alpha [Clostridia bacterium]|nr:L-serine ammonia-lyase, iron-sulfur-dependent, subunit alpha [Clostridia bacterium]
MNLEFLFHQILKPALGCTEPVAVALAASAAVQASAGWTPNSKVLPLPTVKEADVSAIRMRVSRNIFKNAFAILIPNAEGRKGIVMSAALGVFCDPRQGMGLFQNLDAELIRSADALVRSNRVQVSISEEAPSDLFIEVEVELKGGRGECTIRDEHSNITCLKRNGAAIHGCDTIATGIARYSPEVKALKGMNLSELMALVEDLPAGVLSLLRETIEKNVTACKAGLTSPMGIGAGFFGTSGGAPVSVSQYVSSLTAAGSDARMAGYPVEIMTSCGSGNQGIVATIPVVAYARMHLLDEQRLLKALALSHLLTMYITTYVGYLSGLCGVAIKAGTGAACGLTYVMGGGVEDVERAIKIMAATLTGMICDGAKVGCALKVSSAADMAVRAASLAMRKAEVPDDNGIVANTAEQTIENLAQLSRSMDVVDLKLIEIMLAKIPQ